VSTFDIDDITLSTLIFSALQVAHTDFLLAKLHKCVILSLKTKKKTTVKEGGFD
jgi:hypothetical protein